LATEAKKLALQSLYGFLPSRGDVGELIDWRVPEIRCEQASAISNVMDLLSNEFRV
jgi:hypothetical protein